MRLVSSGSLDIPALPEEGPPMALIREGSIARLFVSATEGETGAEQVATRLEQDKTTRDPDRDERELKSLNRC